MSCPPPKDSASRHQRSALVSPKFLYFWHRPVLCAFLFLLLPLMSETSNSSDTQLSSSKSTSPPSPNLLKSDGDSVAAPAAPQVSSSSKQGRGNAVTSNRTGGQAVSTGRKLTARSGRSSCNRSCTIQVGAGCVGGYLSVLIT